MLGSFRFPWRCRLDVTRMSSLKLGWLDFLGTVSFIVLGTVRYHSSSKSLNVRQLFFLRSVSKDLVEVGCLNLVPNTQPEGNHHCVSNWKLHLKLLAASLTPTLLRSCGSVDILDSRSSIYSRASENCDAGLLDLYGFQKRVGYEIA
mgnify:CR=1 FL=1